MSLADEPTGFDERLITTWDCRPQFVCSIRLGADANNQTAPVASYMFESADFGVVEDWVRRRLVKYAGGSAEIIMLAGPANDGSKGRFHGVLLKCIS